MSDQTTDITLDQAIETLSARREEWKIMLDMLKKERENYIMEMSQAETPHDVMKLAGRIATLEELRQMLTPPGWD